MAVRNSLLYNRKIGFFTAIGFGLGVAVHVLYSVAGIGLLIAQSPLLFQIIKYLGAAYLAYIGIKTIGSSSGKVSFDIAEKAKSINPAGAVKIGFLTNVLNPRATLFFMSLFAYIIKPDTPLWVLIAIGAIMVVNTSLWFTLVAIFFSHQYIQNLFQRSQRFFHLVLGGILVLMALLLAFSGK